MKIVKLIFCVTLLSVIITPQKTFSENTINLTKIETFSQYFKFIGTNNEPPELTPNLFLAIVQKGKELIRRNNSLSGDDLQLLNLVRIGSIETSPPQSIARILNKYISDIHYSYEILLCYDDSGKVGKFFYDYPIMPNKNIISADHISIFLEYANNKDYHGMANKGGNIFKKGNQLPSDYQSLFKNFLAENENNSVTYRFYDAHSKYGAAVVKLTIDHSSNKVIFFEAMEKWYK